MGRQAVSEIVRSPAELVDAGSLAREVSVGVLSSLGVADLKGEAPRAGRTPKFNRAADFRHTNKGRLLKRNNGFHQHETFRRCFNAVSFVRRLVVDTSMRPRCLLRLLGNRNGE